jgi:hypothetical protein
MHDNPIPSTSALSAATSAAAPAEPPPARRAVTLMPSHWWGMALVVVYDLVWFGPVIVGAVALQSLGLSISDASSGSSISPMWLAFVVCAELGLVLLAWLGKLWALRLLTLRVALGCGVVLVSLLTTKTVSWGSAVPALIFMAAIWALLGGVADRRELWLFAAAACLAGGFSLLPSVLQLAGAPVLRFKVNRIQMSTASYRVGGGSYMLDLPAGQWAKGKSSEASDVYDKIFIEAASGTFVTLKRLVLPARQAPSMQDMLAAINGMAAAQGAQVLERGEEETTQGYPVYWMRLRDAHNGIDVMHAIVRRAGDSVELVELRATMATELYSLLHEEYKQAAQGIRWSR